MKIQKELALQEEKLRLEEEALYAAQREAARAAKQRKLLEVRGRDPSVYLGPLFSWFSLTDLSRDIFPPRIKGFLLTMNVFIPILLGILKAN